MRALMLGWEYPPHLTGGLGTACGGIAEGLAANGVELTVVLPRAFGDENSKAVRIVGCHSVPTEVLSVDSPLAPYQTRGDYLQRLKALAQGQLEPESAADECMSFLGGYGQGLTREVERYAHAVERIAGGRKFDVIYAHDWMTWPAGMRLARLTGKPLICHVHALEADRAGAAADPGIAAIERLALESAERVICVSRYTAERVGALYGIDSRRISVVHNGIDGTENLVDPRARKGPTTVLFVGRLAHQKGLDVFLRTARQVAEAAPETRFIVVGEGELAQRAKARAEQLGIGAITRFTGFLAGEALESAWLSSDVFLMPSVSEPFGLTALEATIHGLPVVLSKGAGVAEVLPAPTVDFRDVERWTGETLALLEDGDLRKRRVRKAQAALTGRDWTTCGRAVIEAWA